MELDAGATIGHDEGAMTTVIRPPFPPKYHTERGFKRVECEFFLGMRVPLRTFSEGVGVSQNKAPAGPR